LLALTTVLAFDKIEPSLLAGGRDSDWICEGTAKVLDIMTRIWPWLNIGIRIEIYQVCLRRLVAEVYFYALLEERDIPVYLYEYLEALDGDSQLKACAVRAQPPPSPGLQSSLPVVCTLP
jgi:hypothetical protein